MSENLNGVFINYILSALYKKTVVPTDFHGQALAVKELMANDVSGLVQSLTDFQVGAANVNWYIKTGNSTLDGIMAQWLDLINSDFNGQVPSGIRTLASEYYKERWKGSSFPVLKILAWGEVEGFKLPTKMAFVDGSKIYSGLNKSAGEVVEIGENEYFLGDKKDESSRLQNGCIITKPFGRWYDEYPQIYLIKNGVYHNWKMLHSLKDKQAEILEQILPYLLLVKKGTEGLAIQKNVNYDETKLKKVVDQMEELITRMNDVHLDSKRKSKTPIRVSQFDEEIKHLIPDLGTILKVELTTGFEKGILAGLGFIDIADAVSSSRRESVLNPKPFIQEVYSGIGDGQDGSGFAQILKDLLIVIKKQNEGRPKYTNLNMKVMHSKPQIFMDKDYRDFLLSMYNRGQLSQKTLIEVAGDQIYLEEVEERKREAKDGNQFWMYPPVVQNQEAAGGNDYLSSKDPEADMKTTQEKLSPDARQKYNKASVFFDGLEGSPYTSIAKLPDTVKKALPSLKAKRQWLATFNNAYHFALGKFEGDVKKAEQYAFSVAWAKTPHSTI
jgi:hypothetical protein